MRIIQDSLRKKQSLLASAAVTCVLICIALFFLYQRAISQVNEGVSALQSQMVTLFNDNELMAEATGVRYQQVIRHALCGDTDVFRPREDAWGINANAEALNTDRGALVTQVPDNSARCIYIAAEYIRAKVHALNPEQHDIHRYIIASDGRWFYWFNPADSLPFSFSTSQMARNPQQFFNEPDMFYDRVLQKSIRKKSLSSTHFYTDKITGDKAYSVVSYIYDLSEGEPSNHIIGYLAYDLSRPELQHMLRAAFDGRVPEGLILGYQSRQDGEMLCILGHCRWLEGSRSHPVSSRYEIKFALPVWLFISQDRHALGVLALVPVLLILLFLLIRYHLNRADLRFYRDPLTGCFTRHIFTLIQQRSLPFMTVILFDCNRFKSINDSYGHQAGDRALQAIADCMLNHVRANSDWVIRSGGDEFVVLLSRTDIAHAHMVAERIAASIAVYPFSPQGQSVPLSVSWGVATCVETLDAAIQQADAEMYRMKKRKGERR
ncbi:GGDEF domain-containing protein [Kluyvera sp.]|uniref:GGDEF domain-containing protein n=1 Tax=Kluyvera sp. TaxID=1538228 RepID=UPI003A8B2EA9